MARFRYSYMRADGTVARAAAEAPDTESLAARLRQEHCYLLHAGPEESWRHRLTNLRFRTGHGALITALHELGTLVKAGLPVDRALSVVMGLFPEPRLAAALSRLHASLRRGVSFADALEAEPKFFSAFHVNIIRAGEESARLDESLLRLAEYLRQGDALRGQILTALIYPAILMLVGIAALVLLATVVLPQLAPIFAEAGQPMPLPTRLILLGAAFLQHFGLALALLLVLGWLALRQSLEKPANRQLWDRLKLRLPLLGGIILAVQTARFARTTGTLLKAGVALPASLGLGRQTVTNSAMSEALRLAILDVRGGRPLHAALRESGIFSQLTTQLVAVGEESSRLDELLIHQAELFERSSSRRIETLVAILVPVLTLGIGAGVAGVLASILLAVMRLNELAS